MKFVGLLFVSCVITVVTCQSTVCTKASDCGANECCMEHNQRKRFFLTESTGICRSLRKQGESCDPFDATSRDNPNLRVIECPCDVGLVCHSSGSATTAHNSFCVHSSTNV